MTAEQIINDIDAHLKFSGKQYYSEFYIGITKNIESRLFGDHNVSKDNSWWIYRTADSAKIARDVEGYYQQKGMRGFNGGGDDESRIVYCYVITSTTLE